LVDLHPSAEDMMKLVEYGKFHKVVGYAVPAAPRYQWCEREGRWRSVSRGSREQHNRLNRYCSIHISFGSVCFFSPTYSLSLTYSLSPTYCLSPTYSFGSV
jgi:hypothetical protein